MRKFLYQLAFVVALSATFAFAQATPSGSGHDQSMTPQAGQKAQAGDIDQSKDHAKAGAVDQDTLIREVKEQLATNPSFSGVNVEVSKDTVTLTGDVPTKDDRTQAKNLAQAVPGVKHVRDHLKVNSAAANSVGAMNSKGETANQSPAPSTAGSIAGNTEAQAGVQSGSAVTGQASSQSATVGNPSGSAIPQSDVAGSQTTAQASGQTGAQPSTPAASSLPQSDVNAGGSQSTQIQQIQTALQQQNITNVQVVNNNNTVQLVGTAISQADKDKAEQIAKQAAPGLSIQNNIQVSNSVNATGTMGNSSSTMSNSSSTTSTEPGATNPSSSTTSPSTSTTPPTSAAQPPMGEASSQAAAQSSQPPAASSQSSSTTTLPQSDVTASQSTVEKPNASTGSQSTSSSTSATPQSDVNAGQSTSSTSAMGSTQSATGNSSDLQGQIETAIKADTALSNCNTNVNVTDSNIELTGTCPTGKEKQSARRVAQSFAGNRKVVDHIKVTGKGNNSGTENMGTGASSPNSTKPSSGSNPPTSSGTTPPMF